MEPRKQAIIDALRAFVRQRPGLEFANYGDLASYRAESRRIAMDKRHAETLLAAVAENDGITADMIVKASESAFSGRLSVQFSEFEAQDPRGNPRALLHVCRHCRQPMSAHKPGSAPQDPWACSKLVVRIDYCTGQYFPTEYRKAVAAVCASALWYYVREHKLPTGNEFREALYAPGNTVIRERAWKFGREWLSAGDWLRAYFRQEFGRTIAGRYFQ